jgi:phage terminase small subunit
MTGRRAPRAPAHLRAATRRWWADVVAEWQLDEHHVRLLTLAGEAWDANQQAGEALRRDGFTYVDRFNVPRPRPEVAIARDSKIAFARLVRELGLDVEAPNASRPPGLRGRA